MLSVIVGENSSGKTLYLNRFYEHMIALIIEDTTNLCIDRSTWN